jgi:hypothetical protein
MAQPRPFRARVDRRITHQTGCRVVCMGSDPRGPGLPSGQGRPSGQITQAGVTCPPFVPHSSQESAGSITVGFGSGKRAGRGALRLPALTARVGRGLGAEGGMRPDIGAVAAPRSRNPAGICQAADSPSRKHGSPRLPPSASMPEQDGSFSPHGDIRICAVSPWPDRCSGGGRRGRATGRPEIERRRALAVLLERGRPGAQSAASGFGRGHCAAPKQVAGVGFRSRPEQAAAHGGRAGGGDHASARSAGGWPWQPGGFA